MAKLRHQWKMFADEYIIHGNIYKAAINAGYSENYARTNASKLLEKDSIKAYTENKLEELQRKNIATAEDVLLKFTAILNQELTEEKVEVNPLTGEYITIEKKPTVAEVIRAGVELMKRYPTTKELERIDLEVEKLKQETKIMQTKAESNESDNAGVDLIIVDAWSDDDEENFTED